MKDERIHKHTNVHLYINQDSKLTQENSSSSKEYHCCNYLTVCSLLSIDLLDFSPPRKISGTSKINSEVDRVDDQSSSDSKMNVETDSSKSRTQNILH